MTLYLPTLAYSKDALAPYMSKETVSFHYDKHHAAYVTNANALLDGAGMASLSLEELVKKSWQDKITGLFNNAGQHWNHTLFWSSLTPKMEDNCPSKQFSTHLQKCFDDFCAMKEELVTQGLAQFGSGWVWLVFDNNKLKVMKTPNGENPLIHGINNVLLGCDVWEHSYYIDYRNDRKAYLKQMLDNIVNWQVVSARFESI